LTAMTNQNPNCRTGRRVLEEAFESESFAFEEEGGFDALEQLELAQEFDELADEDEFGRPGGAAARVRSRAARPKSGPQRPKPSRAGALGRRARGGVEVVRPAGCVCPAHGTEYVRWVQSALNQLQGLRLPITGVMGAQTRAALRSFQQGKGLPADGIAGPDTEQALREARPGAPGAQPAEPQPGAAQDEGEVYEFETLDFESPASMPTLRRGARGSAVTDLQGRLAAAGFSPGTADGIFGSLTDAALRSFQHARGLRVDGIADPNTWGALLRSAPSVSSGGAPWPRPSTPSRLSGATWVAEFPGSKSIDSLAQPFRDNVARFVAALAKAGATCTISATLRPPERAYLMHYAWRIVKEGLSPTAVPPYPGVNIQWVHTDSKGTADLAASRAAADEMVRAYRLADKAALTSRHIEARAVDMTIVWSGNLVIPDGRSGVMKTIQSSPRNGGENRELWAVGASYGVIKLVKEPPDPPHWSDDGH